MKIFHIHLTLQGKDHVALRYFWDNPFNYQEHCLSLAQLNELKKQAETDYYTHLAVDYLITGTSLYKWLDQSDHLLSNAINKPHLEGLIIAIATDEGLANQPWELLHDGNSFLVEKRPPVIPVRWVTTRQTPISIDSSPQNRPLNVLFMATSPLGIEPVLDYESEEGQIVAATQRSPVNLRVEESGCLSELNHVVKEFTSGFFDIFHLMGHATLSDNKPCFFTENEYGDRVDSYAENIVDALQFPLPRLVFLSGCRTGYAAKSAVPSMAESLINMGALAVLGWGENVRDQDATAMVSALYQDLATGRTLPQAIASTYQTLIRQAVHDWHKLRLYVGHTLPAALVTPLQTKGRNQLSSPSIKIEFRDDEGRLRVVSREEFVGRRRQLQNCLRAIKADSSKVGVLIYGMGGWGKSSIASRLWDRLPEHKKVLWWRQLNEPNLIKKIKHKLSPPIQLELGSYLENSQITLESRLTYLFNHLAEQGEPPFLIIFDDFEWNLEPYDGRYVLNPEVTSVLTALVKSIQETRTGTRILITCRYEFDSILLRNFFSQGLEPLKNAELTKKLNRLEHFRSGKLPDKILERAIALADGNPRLLEFLNNEILSVHDAEAKLFELEQNPIKWSEQIVWKELYELIDFPLQKVLSHSLVYSIPVPMVALEIVCQNLPNYQQELQRARQLGLLEVSAEVQEEAQTYRVSRILPHILSDVGLLEESDVYSICQTAHEALSKLWGHPENIDKMQWVEIFRLKFLNRDNPERFREGFSQLLSVQSVQENEHADRAFEVMLMNFEDEQLGKNSFDRLKKYLFHKDWQKADEETAWLFYLVMVRQDYKNWANLLYKFPGEILNKIDKLWVKYSKGKFGFSVQKSILEDIWESPKSYTDSHSPFDQDSFDEEDIVQLFCSEVGWSEIENYNNLSFAEEDLLVGTLPLRTYTRWRGVGIDPGEWYRFYRKKDGLGFLYILENNDLSYKS